MSGPDGAEPAGLRFSVLGSGSSGNATYVELDGWGLIIDAGYGAVELERRLACVGRHLAGVRAILLTHEHHDHVRGLSSLTRRLPLTLVATAATLKRVAARIHPQTTLLSIRSGGHVALERLDVHAFPLVHDAADPVGFVLERSGRRLGYLTDLGMISPPVLEALDPVEALIMEANHDVETLERGPYPWPLKRRILAPTGHLSNEGLLSFLRRSRLERCRSLTLAHLSRTNNCPELALGSALMGLEGRLLAEQLRCAPQDRPTPLETVGAAPEHAGRQRAAAATQLSFVYD